MKSLFVSFAALGLVGASPVMAQSNAGSSVGISGWIDIGVSKKTGGGTDVGTLGRSSIAFAGTEDLGGGLAATFRLSHRFELDTGTVEASDAQRPFWKDEATMGLKGLWGSVRLGRALTPLWSQAWVFDAWSNFDRIASPHWWQFLPDYLSGVETRAYAHLNNGVFYDSPNWSGFQFHAVYSPEKRGTERGQPVGFSLNYEKDALALMLGAERNSQKDEAAFFGAGYTLASVRWLFSYSQVKLDPEGVVYSSAWTNWSGASAPHTKRSSVNLSASYAIGAHTLKAGVGRDFQGSTSGFNYIGSTFNKAGTGFSGPAALASLGYAYSFSKRTTGVVDVSRTQWKTTDDSGRTSASGAAVGLSHAF